MLYRTINIINKIRKLTILTMIDLYLIITPISGLIALLTVINLKFALNQPKSQDLTKYEKKKPQNANQQIQPTVKMEVKDQIIQPGFKKTFSYLIKNFSIAEFCFVRRCRNKIPILLSTTIIALLSIAINLPYVFCFVGTIITLIFVFGKMLTQQEEDDKQNIKSAIIKDEVKKSEKFEKKLQVIFTSLSLIINLLFIGFAFKNYRNPLLISVIQNFLITITLDNLLLKPIVLTLTALAIKNIVFVDNYIDKQLQIIEILHEQRVMKNAPNVNISALSPKKLRSSPSKVPRAVQIEPRINLQNTDKYLSTIQLTKSLRKPKLSPISLKKASSHQNVQGDCSLISILHSHQKKKNFNQNSSFDFDKSLFEQKVYGDEPIPEIEIEPKSRQEPNKEKDENQESKKNKMQGSKLIMISQNNSIINNFENDDIQNQEEQDVSNNKSIVNHKSLKDSDYKTISKNCDGLKISLHRSIEDQNDNKENLNESFGQEDNHAYQLRPHSTLQEDNSILGYGTITNTSRRHGLLKINEDRGAEDLEQIDLNSPERRKQHLNKIEEDAEKPKKKKKGYKKYSLDPNRHVIKHSTGEPYLEFLPNLLNKQREQKKKKSSNQGSQHTFSRKVDLMNGFVNESRLTKSVKRTKNSKDPIVKQNDENKIPEFIIEDFN